MPLEFIPNQPFIFSDPIGDQSCLNNDIRQGSQIVTAGDTICVQQKITPCDALINEEPTMSSGAGASATTSWTVSGGWSSASPGTLSFDGTGGVVGTATQAAGTLLAGRAYRIEFTIASVTGMASVVVELGNQQSELIYDETGDYVVYLIPNGSGSDFTFNMNASATTAGDTMSITNIDIYNVTTQWYDDSSFAFQTWRYSLVTDDFLTYANGKFCSDYYADGDLVNDNAYATDGNYHGVSFRITDCSQGGVQVTLGGTVLGTVTGSGEYTLYGTPNDASLQLVFAKTDLFDGCIDNVTVDDYGFLDTGFYSTDAVQLYVANSSGVGITDVIPFSIHDDRITWCFNVDDLTNDSNPIELACSLTYRLLIVVQCPEEVATNYVSETILRYDPDGWDCTKVVQAWSEGYNLGFYFGDIESPTFKLTQRLRVLRYNPKYPVDGDDYLYSSGQSTRPFAQRGKVRECHFDRVDESTHDVIATQIICDKLYIDAVQCFVPTKTYEPEWGANGRYNLAQSRIEIIQTNEPTIFNRTN